MKLINFAAFSMATIFMLSLTACGDGASTKDPVDTKDTTAAVNTTTTNAVATNPQFSYAFGLLIGKNFSEGLGLVLNEVNIDDVGANLVAVLDGTKTGKDVKAAQVLDNNEAQKLAQFKQSGQGTKSVSPQLSASFGMFFGNALKTQGLSASDLNVDDFKTGVKAAMGEGTPTMDFQAAETLVNGQMQAMQQAQGQKNLEAGKKFLEEVSKKEGIQSTASGIHYEILKKGTGAKPTPQNKVKTHYHGTLIDGTVFDSSVERGEPIEFQVGGVIQGWQEILPMMPTGSKWRVYIPSHLAYGPQGSPGGIPPNSALIFEIELFSFQ